MAVPEVLGHGQYLTSALLDFDGGIVELNSAPPSVTFGAAILSPTPLKAIVAVLDPAQESPKVISGQREAPFGRLSCGLGQLSGTFSGFSGLNSTVRRVRNGCPNVPVGCLSPGDGLPETPWARPGLLPTVGRRFQLSEAL